MREGQARRSKVQGSESPGRGVRVRLAVEVHAAHLTRKDGVRERNVGVDRGIVRK